MKRAFWCVAVAGFAGFAPGANAGVFELFDDDYLLVESSFESGTLHDQSIADIGFGGSVSSLTTNHQSMLNMLGGSMDELNAFDDCVINFFNGDGFSISSFNNTTINMWGGKLSKGIDARDNTTINFHSGVVDGIDVRGTSSLQVHGGIVGPFAGFGGIGARDSSDVKLYGGDIPTLAATDSSTVEFIVSDFVLGMGLSMTGNEILGTGFLSGTWGDGSSFNVLIDTNEAGALVFITIPAPGAAMLLGLALRPALKRRRRSIAAIRMT